jgi:ATP-dependent DNA helicase RecG
MAPALLEPLQAEVEGLDSPSLPRRREALSRVMSWLEKAGAPAPVEVVPDPEPAPEEPAKTRRRRAAVGKEASRNEARLLSIAPRSGPLSMLLKDAGFRTSPKLLGSLYKRGIRRVGDVLFLLPRCYEDRRQLSTIAQLEHGDRAVVIATVKRAEDVYLRRGRRSFRAVVGDATGNLSLTYFQGAPWLKARFPVGARLVVSGELRITPSGYEMVHPEIEPADDGERSPIHFKRLVPIYPGLERQEQRSFRELAFRVVQKLSHHLEDPLPIDLRERARVMPLVQALQTLHFPPDDADLEKLNGHISPAHQRLAFDELFFLQLGLLLRRVGIQQEPGIAFRVTPARMAKAKAALPFTLTGAQTRTVEEIARDMALPQPMHRMLQGDVGSGKTAVALVAAQLALADGFQVALMAPTEILAAQHQQTFEKILGPLGIEVVMLKGGLSAKERSRIRGRIRSGDARMVLGTHALFEADVEFAKLGLVLIDEQHRFGVLQRQALAGKGLRPDVLVMTATPIPRTLAMTLYGDLALSVLDELPPGRTPIQTRIFTRRQRARALEALQVELEEGHQAYVVYPLVEESEKSDLADATQGAATLAEAYPQFRVGLLHGRMKAEEKAKVMDAFRSGAVQLLVSTTVIEVGVDVANASVMVIEEAERFGLSQLHQLRGRVGRGAAVSYCFLLPGGSASGVAAERLSVLATSNDGFVIAEKDLELRGAGEFLGTRQSGIPELAVANLARDGVLLAQAQALAQEVVAQDPSLKRSDHRSLATALEERWEGRLALARVA